MEIDFDNITEIIVLVPFKININGKKYIIHKEVHITAEDMM